MRNKYAQERELYRENRSQTDIKVFQVHIPLVCGNKRKEETNSISMKYGSYFLHTELGPGKDYGNSTKSVQHKRTKMNG